VDRSESSGRWRIGFRYAIAGIYYALRTQKNTWVHICFTVTALAVGFWLKIDLIEWALVILVAGLVWSTELINTAVEATLDLISPEPHPLAKVAKDASAGGVLIAAGTAVCVGLLVFGPPLLERMLQLLGI
jgi:diacylglycerol kinase